MIRHVLCDLDDTLYAYRPCEAAATAAATASIARDLAMAEPIVEAAWAAARVAVKGRVDGTGASHDRFLYLVELVHAFCRPDMLTRARSWERTYWDAYLAAMVPKPRVEPFFEAMHAKGAKAAIVTDLVVEPQLAKIERLGLARWISALAVSEEVERDKPHDAIFRLAADRLGVPLESCVVIGDNDAKDGEGARRLGLPFYWIDPSDPAGAAFDVVREELFG